MEHWTSKFKLRFPVFALLLVTLLFWSLYDRYEVAGPVLLESPVLADAIRCSGVVSESDGGRFALVVPEASGKRVDVRFRIPTATEYSMIRVRARARVEGVVVGKSKWRCARLIFIQYDSIPKWMPGTHGLMSADGTQGWKSYERVFEMFPGVAYAEVALQQLGLSGRVEFEHVEVQPVRMRASFVWWRILFAGAWLAAAVYYFPRCRLHRRKLSLLILLNALAIVSGALMPSDWIKDGSDWVKETWTECRAPVPVKSNSKIEKKAEAKRGADLRQMERFNEVVGDVHRTGHFALFASLCFLVYCSAALERQHPAYFFKVGFDVLIFAIVTESLQFLTIDRTAGVGDLLVDVYGMAAAFVLFLMVLPLLRRKLSRA